MISNFLRVLELSAEKLFWLFLFCSFLFGLPMFIPDRILAALGLVDFLDANRSRLGGLFLFVFSGLLTIGTTRLFKWMGNNWREGQTRKKREIRLQNLNPTERGVLHPFLVTNRRTLSLVEDGTKDDLAESGSQVLLL